MSHPGGRPLKFKTEKELSDKIDKYFKYCDENKKPYTITGLAIYLDTTRDLLIDYEEKEEYSDTIKKAKLKCEAYAEEQLFQGKNVAGVIFNMTNNYKRGDNPRTNKQEFNHGGQKGNPIQVDVLSEEQKKIIAQQILNS